MNHADIAAISRCPRCGEKMVAIDDYGDYIKFVRNDDGRKVRKSEARLFDIDWVIQDHIANNH